MKVRVCYTTDVPDDFRRALSCSWGFHGEKASRSDIQNHMMNVGSSTDDDLMDEWRNCDVCHPEAP